MAAISTDARMTSHLLLILGFICSLSTTRAADFYISPAGHDDTGTGTRSAPWKTLHKATASVSTPGSLIRVLAGEYLETQQCHLAVGVSLEGEGITSIIKTTVTDEWAALLMAVSVEGTHGNQHIAHLKFDGRNLATHTGIQISGRSHVSVHDVTIIDFKNRGVIFSGRGGDGNPLPPAIYATGNRFYNNQLHNCSEYDYSRDYGTGCLNLGGQEGMLIHDNTITQTSRPVGQNGWPIKYTNRGWTKGCKIFRNVITKIPFAPGGNWDFSLEMFNNSGLEIYENTFQGSLDFNYQEKGAYPYSIYIHDNLIAQPVPHNSIESGIIMEFSIDGFWVKNNIFRNISKAIVCYPRTGDTLKNIVITNNLATGIYDPSGIFYGGYESGDGKSFQENITILNNTITTRPGNAPYFAINFGTTQPGYHVKNARVHNNIIQGFTAHPCRSGSLALVSDSRFSHNVLHQNTTNEPMFPSWASTTTFPASTTVGGNLAAVAPQFAPASHFALQAGSPLIDAGLNVGLPYLGPAPDIGYAEYNTAFNITSVHSSAATGTVTLQWDSIAGQPYSIWRSSDLRPDTWMQVGAPLTGQNITTTAEIEGSPSAPRLFYKVSHP